MLEDTTLQDSHLGKKTEYIDNYSPHLLFPVSRHTQRQQLKITNILPFHGYDGWNAYEISWLNPKGKPEVAIGEFYIPCETPFLIESKSFKLYLNSLNNTVFQNIEIVQNILSKDLSEKTQGNVRVTLTLLKDISSKTLHTWKGICLDEMDIECHEYQVNSSLLMHESIVTEETVYSHLLRSNCPITGQPDWGSVSIHYRGKKIQHAGLLKYIVSFRNHSEFHEHCVERIFMDIQHYCQPETLTVEACYTRRGGLDINPLRTTDPLQIPRLSRLYRQ